MESAGAITFMHLEMTEEFSDVNGALFFTEMNSSEMIRTKQTSFSDTLITSETHDSHEWLLTMAYRVNSIKAKTKYKISSHISERCISQILVICINYRVFYREA
jgi:hypothetical protein